MRERWSRRRYRRHPDYGYQRGGNSCLRDACLLEAGCCIGEAIDGSCLMLGLLSLPSMLFTVARAPRSAAAADGPLVGAIRRYQREVSAKRDRPCCRFTPSCSHYAAEAITRHGAVRGLWLATRRLGRCRPGGAHGPDPVPA
ncbi:membrane protein insertion efficiency factor YidD [Dactylosporangium sp. NPDC048998]|uniref:membrane protein insertion efficiency factor YidD n=1 Tax=Dactylosporangium sp. NPDC048998 TaxID=3363976 RepID=UPI00371047E5